MFWNAIIWNYIIFIKGHNSGSSSIGGSQGGGLSVLSSSRLRTITNLTRKLSLSNSRILTGSSSGASSLEATHPINRVVPSRGSTANSSNSLPPHSSHIFKASRSMNGIGRTKSLCSFFTETNICSLWKNYGLSIYIHVHIMSWNRVHLHKK